MVLIISYNYIIASSDCTYLEQQTHISVYSEMQCNKKMTFLMACWTVHFIVTNPGFSF